MRRVPEFGRLTIIASVIDRQPRRQRRRTRPIVSRLVLTGKVHAIRKVEPIETVRVDRTPRAGGTAGQASSGTQSRASGSLFGSAANDLYQLAARRHNTAARERQTCHKSRSPHCDTPNRIGSAVVRMTSNKQGVLT